MATHASIATLNYDGTVSVSYCHYDGFTDRLGRILKEHFNTQSEVITLIRSGPIVGIEPEGDHVEIEFDDDAIDSMRSLGQCLCTHCEDFQHYLDIYCVQEYNYIFVDGKWTVAGSNRQFSKF